MNESYLNSLPPFPTAMILAFSLAALIHLAMRAARGPGADGFPAAAVGFALHGWVSGFLGDGAYWCLICAALIGHVASAYLVRVILARRDA